MYKQFKDINSIRFPVFALPSVDWYRQDGVLFIDDGKVLDDTNMPGPSLGIRRIQCGRTDLQKLKKAYTDFNSMIKGSNRIFIDSNGTPFVYKKTINAPLVHHMITSVTPSGDHSVVRFKNIIYPMSIPRPPYGDARWARILYFKGSPWMIYDFVTDKGKDSFKRV